MDDISRWDSNSTANEVATVAIQVKRPWAKLLQRLLSLGNGRYMVILTIRSDPDGRIPDITVVELGQVEKLG